MKPNKKLQIFMVRLLFVYLIILGFLSLNPWLLPSSGRVISFVTWDMLAHAASYSGLSLLMLVCLRTWQQPLVLIMFVVLFFCSSIGILFEYCQYWFTLTRQFSFYDIAANFFGVVLGLFYFGVFRLTRFYGNV